MSQPVRACKPGMGDLSMPTAPAYFWGVKIMFVGIMNFGQIQKIRFVVVKIFWSNSNQFLVILIWSSAVASFISEALFISVYIKHTFLYKYAKIFKGMFKKNFATKFVFLFFKLGKLICQYVKCKR